MSQDSTVLQRSSPVRGKRRLDFLGQKPEMPLLDFPPPALTLRRVQSASIRVLSLTALVTMLWAGEHASVGYIDTLGKFVIAPQFEAAEGFHEGRALVTLADDTRAFIDRFGKTVFKPKYSYGNPHEYHAGLVWVQPDLFVHCVDSLGRSLFPDSFYDAGDFHEGLALVNTKDARNSDVLPNWGFIDRSGTIVIPARFSGAGGYSRGFSEGLAAVAVGGQCVHEREWEITGRRWGFIDRSGEMVIEARYDFAHDFHSGRALVKDGTGYAFINHACERVIELRKGSAVDFSEGLCAVRDSSDKYGYIDTLGRMVIPARYAVASSFSEGRAYVQFKYGGKFGCIDRSGELVIPAEYENVKAFHDGRAAVEVRRPDGILWHGFIDRQGKLVIPATYWYAGDFSEGLAPVMIPDK